MNDSNTWLWTVIPLSFYDLQEMWTSTGQTGYSHFVNRGLMFIPFHNTLAPHYCGKLFGTKVLANTFHLKSNSTPHHGRFGPKLFLSTVTRKYFFRPWTKKEAPDRENSEQLSRTPKKALKWIFRPRAPIPNYSNYDSDNCDTSNLVGEETENEVMTVMSKKKKWDLYSNPILFNDKCALTRSTGSMFQHFPPSSVKGYGLASLFSTGPSRLHRPYPHRPE